METRTIVNAIEKILSASEDERTKKILQDLVDELHGEGGGGGTEGGGIELIEVTHDEETENYILQASYNDILEMINNGKVPMATEMFVGDEGGCNTLHYSFEKIVAALNESEQYQYYEVFFDGNGFSASSPSALLSTVGGSDN